MGSYNRKSRDLRGETADQWEKRIVGSRWVKTADQWKKRIMGSRWVKTAEKTRAQKSKVQVGEEGVVLLKNNTNKKKK